MKKTIRMGFLAILVLLIVLSAAACGNGKGNESPAIDETTDTQADTTDTTAKNYVRSMAVIKNVSGDGSEIDCLDVESSLAFTLLVDDTAVIKDAYGSPLMSMELTMGDMVETKYDTHDMKPEYIRITAVAWKRSDVRNMTIDKNNMTITIGSDRYDYTEDMVVASNGIPIDLDQLSSSDDVVIRGYQSTVWSIVVEQGHGTLTLASHRAFIGGVMTVDNLDTYKIESNMSIPISAGKHSIVMEKGGISSYTAEVDIVESEETILDLGDVQIKIGMVDFIFMQDGVKLYIDGAAQDTSKDITLEFGTYEIKAEKDNYAPFTGELTVNQAYIQYKIDLDQEPIYLHVDTPEECELYIDGSFIGIIPATTPIDPGEHVITIRKEGFYLKNHRVIVDDSGKDIYYAFPDLLPMPAEPEPDQTTTDASM